MKETFQISSRPVDCYFNSDFSGLQQILKGKNIVYVTDENVFNLHRERFPSETTIVIKAGEAYKQQATVDNIIQQLIKLKADRQTFLVGVGGGVVTDITGYVASVYMRGVQFGFAPTSLLAMVDASIGGKNGVDVGVYKNLVGCIKQPEFLLYDYAFLQTLPKEEWINGFAEIIKHAAIKDAVLFASLQHTSIEDYINSVENVDELIQQNVKIKMAVVAADEYEKGDRKLLNFGHTLGHAIENSYKMPHGFAISIGMVAAAALSQQVNNLGPEEVNALTDLLQQYHLPVYKTVDAENIWEVLLMDKKNSGAGMHFILLDKIGKAKTMLIATDELKAFLIKYYSTKDPT